jgi:lysosomal acid lipase/cholesteryl ester hydrolase
VWLGNNRGTKYSDTHKYLSKEGEEYWDFYQEDMGLKDLPALIDFIKMKTNLSQISYIGHSEGTT